tara:strand:+ start:1322 stop:2470 length:1149 start_codon:yes stop_codon:yes gene_type:complete
MELLELYKTIRNKSVEICKPLHVEDFTPQSAVFASPPKWHLAHTTWFFEEMILKNAIDNYEPYDSAYGFLFNSYYNTVGERIERGERGLITRPSVDEVFNYRNHVDQLMIELLSNSTPGEFDELTTLGINHEQQHQELLITDLKYTLSKNPIHPVYSSESNFVENVEAKTDWISVEEGVYTIGKAGTDFSFDNEHGKHKVYIQPFEISGNLVTNGEYIEFIESEGYSNHTLWLDEGWSWVNQNKVSSPLYWKLLDNEWHYYTLSGFKKIDKNAVLSHVSYYEAAAFATYKEMRLPTEFEWEVASDKLKWGLRWEWTNSAYLPYPNFKIKEGAVGEYNGKFMINQMVLRGGSTATSFGHSRKTYRNFFHPGLQWQFSGIRLAK